MPNPMQPQSQGMDQRKTRNVWDGLITSHPAELVFDHTAGDPSWSEDNLRERPDEVVVPGWGDPEKAKAFGAFLAEQMQAEVKLTPGTKFSLEALMNDPLVRGITQAVRKLADVFPGYAMGAMLKGIELRQEKSRANEPIVYIGVVASVEKDQWFTA